MDSPTTVPLSASGHVELPLALREGRHWLEAMELAARLKPSALLIQPKKLGTYSRMLGGFRRMKHSGNPFSDPGRYHLV